MCICSVKVYDSVGVEITNLKYSTQSDRRLAQGSKKPVRQCVKVVNAADASDALTHNPPGSPASD